MKNRIYALMAALVMAMSLLVLSPTAASASSGSNCITHYYESIRTCMAVTWFNDGGNVRVTSIGQTTPVGCGQLQATRYPERYAELPTGNLYMGATNYCDQSTGFYWLTGNGSVLIVHLRANINNAKDHSLWWKVRLYTDGRMVVVDKAWTQSFYD